MMKCQKCNKDFEEKDIDESHDVPCYLFEGNRKGRKNQADLFGRHYLCNKCHKLYEASLRFRLRHMACLFANEFFNFKKGDEDGECFQKV